MFVASRVVGSQPSWSKRDAVRNLSDLRVLPKFHWKEIHHLTHDNFSAFLSQPRISQDNNTQKELLGERGQASHQQQERERESPKQMNSYMTRHINNE